MITQTADRNATVNAGERSEFRITESAKIFHMLISGLYSNKPQSITREIWSNALDAQIEVGRGDKPFDVTLPSVFDPVFKVRDYGDALSHEQVMDLYTNLGKSTKENSNEGVGKFGIGSKSPFSYTDTFSVTVYKDGESRFYSSVIERGGIPAMYLMHKDKTDQENGIEVSFPVESADINAFRRAAKRVAHGFDVKPRVLGLSDQEEQDKQWDDIPVVTNGPGWKLLSGALDGYQQKAYAKMGCVLYPIDIDAIDNLTTDERAFLNSTMIIDFKIGDLEITPSRETLSYGRGEPTISSIQTRIKYIVQEMVDQIVKSYTDCATYWEACEKYRQHFSMNIPQSVKGLVKNRATWHGVKLVDYIEIRKQPDCKLNFCEISGKAINHVTLKFDNWQKTIQAIPGKNTILVIENLALPIKLRAKRVAARIKNHRNNNKNIVQYIWVKFSGNSKEESSELITLLETVNGIEILNAADLVEPPKNMESTARRAVSVREYLHSRYNAFDDRYELSADEKDNGGFYIPLERNCPVIPEGMSGPFELVAAMRAVKLFSGSEKIYGVPKTLIKDFESDDWVSVYEYAESYFESTACRDSIQEYRAMKECVESDDFRFFGKNVKTAGLKADSDMLSALNFYTGIKDKAQDVSGMEKLAIALGKKDIGRKEDHKIYDEMHYYIQLAHHRYPLLDLLAKHIHYTDIVDKVSEYVYMCDTAHQSIKQSAYIAA